MPSLGQMLVEDKVVSPAQLEEAIQSQVIFGGRFGTNLLELGLIDEPTLTKYLARKHGVPTVDWSLLNRIKPEILKLFTKKLAKKTEAFPLKLDGRDLYVVMADPSNVQAIEEITFATGKRVKPLVLPEVRVYDLLNRFYGVGREFRYINLAMMLGQKKEETRPAAPEVPAGPPPGVDEKLWREREALRSRIAADAAEELLSETEFQRIADQQWARMGKAETEAGSPVPAALVTPETAPPVSAGVPKTEAPGEPTPPPPPEPMPRLSPLVAPRRQPYREAAQSLYSILSRAGVLEYLPKATLQEFLKLFVKNQLKNFVLPLNHLANWLIIEADVPVEMIEAALLKFQEDSKALGITAVLPGERPAEEVKSEAVPPAAVEAGAEKAAEEVEVVEAAEVMEEVEDLHPEALEPVEAEELPFPPSPPPEEAAIPPGESAPAGGEQSAETFQVLTLTETDLASTELTETVVTAEEPEEEEEYPQLTLQEAQSKLFTEVTDRKDISRIIIGFARGFFKRSLLFTVRGQTLFGWDGHGPGINAGLVESIMLPLTETSVFKLVNQTMSFFLGPIPAGPINDRFLKFLGGERPNNVFIMPVIANQQVVYMLYGDNGAGEFVPPNAPELQILAYQIPRSLEQLIQRKKSEARQAKIV